MKKNNNQESEQKEENALQIFIRNYKNVEGFRLLTKFLFYVVFVFTIVMLAHLFLGNKMPKAASKTTTTAPVNNVYNDMLNKLLDNSDYKCEIKINDNNYTVDGSFGNNILTGILNNELNFKIKDNVIYEIKDGNEIVNDTLFSDIDTSILLNNKLVDILKNNSSIILKEENDTSVLKYDNVKINDLSYTIKVTKNNGIQSIEVNSNDKYVYVFNYNINY